MLLRSLPRSLPLSLLLGLLLGPLVPRVIAQSTIASVAQAAVSATAPGVRAPLSLTLVLLDPRSGDPLPPMTLRLAGAGSWVTDIDGLVQLPWNRELPRLQVELADSNWVLVAKIFALDTSQDNLQLVLEALPRKGRVGSAGSAQNPQQNSAQKFSPTPPQAVGSATGSATRQADMVVVARREPLHQRKQVSTRTVDREEMQQVAATQGDPLQVLKTLPGVTTQSDLSVRPYVRGGDERETRVFWNEIPLLQPYHAMSAYSVFNMEAIDEMTFHSGDFPVEADGALSGAVRLRSRPPDVDSLQAFVHASMLRANGYLSVPLIPGKLSAYASYQAFLYDWMIKRTLDVATLIEDSPNFNAEVDKYQKYTDLPNFKDLEFGARWQISSTVNLSYTGLRALDIFRVLDPTTVIESETLSVALRKVDTLALVEIPNNIHGLTLDWQVSPTWVMRQSLAYQGQNWAVSFPDAEGNLEYHLQRSSWQWRTKNLVQLNSRHLVTFGTAAGVLTTEYDVRMPRFLHEVLLMGSADFIETVGLFNPEGFAITETDVLSSVGEVMDNLMMDYEGKRTQWNSAAYVGDRWEIDADNRLQFGVRFEYLSSGNDFWPSPRISWFHRLSPHRELTLATGLYAQDDFPFYYRHYNPDLLSEKAWHLGAEYSVDLGEHVRLEVGGWFKSYFDLATYRVTSTDQVNTELFLERVQILTGYDPDSLINEAANALGVPADSMREQMDTAVNYAIEQLPQEIQADVRTLFAERRLDFSSTGQGMAVGSELGIHFDPSDTWHGWASYEASTSLRQDRDGEFWYPFRRHRPWSLKLQNWWDFPNQFQLSVRVEHSAGMVYTGFTDFTSIGDGAVGDTVFVVERRNNSRYGRYTRLDLRLTKDSQLLGHPFRSIFEVWNAWMNPNLFLVDSESGQFKWFEMNYPFPTFFMGWEWRF
jgi:hypothetical protein